MSTPHEHVSWTHGHVFLGHGHERSESRARLVTLLTAAFMVVEIVTGLLFGSMALLADGVHMATHVGALGLAAAAYWLARRHAHDTRFSFGSGKFGDLAAFASAVVLGLLSIGVAIESARRFVAPVPVHYSEALIIAVIGLLVNIASAAILHDPQEHHHHHGEEDHHHHDNNLRAAYMHVLADAATSVLAILALGSGMLFHTAWADPLVGVVGAVVIASWAYGLIRDSALVLLDAEDDPEMAKAIRHVIEQELGARVLDLHLWRLGPGHHGLIVSLAGTVDPDSDRIKHLLTRRYPSLSHLTVEINLCEECGSA